jgi:hypothetical protein
MLCALPVLGFFESIHAEILYNVLHYFGKNGLLEKLIRKYRDNSETNFKEIGPAYRSVT